MFHVRWHKLYNYYHITKYGASNAKETVDVLESLLKVTRVNSYNNSGKFKGIYVIGSRFHNNLPLFSPELWQIINDSIMELITSIVNHTENKFPVIKKTMMLSSKTMIDEKENEIVNNDFRYSDPFQPGTFAGSSEVDVSLSQTRIEFENIVDDTLVTTGTFYKQPVPLFQEMTNSCSTKVQFDTLFKMMRNQNTKHIAAKGINSAYGRSKDSVLFGEYKTSKRNTLCHRFTQKKKSKK